MKHTTAHAFIEDVAKRNPNQPEFLQAVAEVVDSLWPFLQNNPHYAS